MLDYLDLDSLETKTIADGNEIITKGVSIKINENMNINEIMDISEEAVKNLLADLNPDKIYNFAFGGVYISVRIHNVIYTIEMQNESQIKSFLLSEYEDDTLKKTKRSISATPKYKKSSDEYGQYDHRYLFIRYISEDCSIDIDDISINEEKLINFINSVVNGNLNDLYNKMFT